MAKLEFAKYTDVTKAAKELDQDFYGQYEKVLICPDVKTVWISKILKGYDEDYNQVENSIIIERNNLDDFSAKEIDLFNNHDNFIKILFEADIDDGCNWDVTPADDMEDALDMLSDGFGIIDED